MGISGVPTDLRALAKDYEFLRELGRGGMAAVYLARDRELDREVAIKLIRAAYAQDDEVVARFAREARLLARLDHPNIVRVYAVRRMEDQGVALVMQHVPGATLRQTVGIAGALPVELALSVLRDVGAALAYAHARGIVHRDVKPENIFLQAGTARALLSDFGIAHSTEGDSLVTLSGAALGTPTYMSPEQIEGIAVDGRSDIYALGVVAWEMLSGQRLWEGDGIYTILYKHKHEQIPSLAGLRPDVPPSLIEAIERALQKDRDQRWPSMQDFLRQLPAPGDLPPPLRSESVPQPEIPRIPDSEIPTVRFRRPARRRALLPLALAGLTAVAIAGALADRHASTLQRRSDALAYSSRDGDVTSAKPSLDPLPATSVPGPAPAATPVSARATRRTSSPRSHADSLALCRMPGVAAQRACLYAHLSESDVELERAYHALIAELRNRAGPPRGAFEPESVQRLRQAQRAWLVERDTLCRRRTRPSEGPLWAPVRARCLGELSAQRAQKLTYDLLKLRSSVN